MTRTLGALLFLLAAHTAAEARTYTYTYTFAHERLVGKWAGDTYQEPGMPTVPTVTARILIPRGERVKSVHVVPERIVVRNGVTAPAASSYYPACRVKFIPPPAVSFAPGRAYPATHSGPSTVQYLHGAPILTVPLFPERYYPGSRRAELAAAATVLVETMPTLVPQPSRLVPYRGYESDRAALADGVDNPSFLSTYPKATKRATADYLVIGPREVVLPAQAPSPLEDLLAAKRARGLTTAVLALEEVIAGQAGRDVQEKIRAAVRKSYSENGTRFLLLVGDGFTQTPTRLFHMRGHDGVEELDLASDMYFGCLDGDFDDNGNDTFGEEGDDSDLRCEVAVGRAPANTREELRVFVDKTLLMEKIPAADPRVWRGLLIADLFDEMTPGSPAMERLVHGSNATVRTRGFPSDARFEKLYEKNEEEYAPEEVIAALNAGDFYTVNQAGHGNQLFAMKFNAKEIPKLVNKTPFLGYTSACLDGDLTRANWASQMVLHPSGGAAAMVANAHYGWYSKRQPEGISNVFHRAYYEMRFGRGIKEIGLMNLKAKELFLGMVARNPFVRHVYYELNVIGDPELQVKF